MPERASRGRRTNGNQSGKARTTSRMTRHARPKTLSPFFFLELRTVMADQFSQSHLECLLLSFPIQPQDSRPRETNVIKARLNLAQFSASPGVRLPPSSQFGRSADFSPQEPRFAKGVWMSPALVPTPRLP